MTQQPIISFDNALRAFTLRIKGAVILPGHLDYDAARTVFNTAIDRRPAIIVQPADAADVARCVRFARAQSLPIAVRSGGHSLAGHSLVDDGLVIDMSTLDAINIDPEARIAWVQPGARTGDVSDRAQAFGLAIPFGDARTVGVGGITLGGGIGFLVRKHGLTIDHLTAVELVTAEGQLVHASATENSELFWGLRGGGGNFGIVTGFQFGLVEAGLIYGGLLAFPATAEVIHAYAEASLQAPDELTSITMVMKAPPAPFVPAEAVGKPVVAIIACYNGDPADGPAALEPLRAIGTPVVEMLQPMPYAAIYNLTDDSTHPGRIGIRSAFVPTLDEELAGQIARHVAAAPPPMSAVQIRPLGGAMARVDPDATAFSHRDANFMLTAISHWVDAGDDGPHHEWVAGVYEAIRPYAEGVYMNFLADEGEARIRDAYSQRSLARLAALKADYDPDNVFRGNQNIAPASAAVERAA